MNVENEKCVIVVGNDEFIGKMAKTSEVKLNYIGIAILRKATDGRIICTK